MFAADEMLTYLTLNLQVHRASNTWGPATPRAGGGGGGGNSNYRSPCGSNGCQSSSKEVDIDSGTRPCTDEKPPSKSALDKQSSESFTNNSILCVRLIALHLPFCTPLLRECAVSNPPAIS